MVESRLSTTALKYLFACVFFGLLCANSTLAADSVKTTGVLNDRDFYRLVACASPPGGKCQKPVLKWSEADAKDITIGITEVESPITQRRLSLARRAVENAVSQINGVGAAVRVRLITEGTPDISVSFVKGSISEQGHNARTVEELFFFGGAAATAQLFSTRGSTRIRSAEVTISDLVENDRIVSVVLEEIVQSLGLITDIHNRYYHSRSVFSETGGRVKRLKGQDARALEIHYPN